MAAKKPAPKNAKPRPDPKPAAKSKQPARLTDDPNRKAPEQAPQPRRADAVDPAASPSSEAAGEASRIRARQKGEERLRKNLEPGDRSMDPPTTDTDGDRRDSLHQDERTVETQQDGTQKAGYKPDGELTEDEGMVRSAREGRDVLTRDGWIKRG